jgi:hypothetical protein
MTNTDPTKKHDQHEPHQKTWPSRTPPKNMTNTNPTKKHDQHEPHQKNGGELV